MIHNISTSIIEQNANRLGISKIAIKSICNIDNKKIVDDISNILPNAKVVISACLNYNTVGDGNILQYTRANYYRVLSKMLHKLAKFIKNFYNDTRPDNQVFRTSVNSTLNDKILAITCRLGTFCTNHLVCVPQVGIKTILGHLIIDADVDNDSNFDCQGECDNCQFCINACPTGALSVNGVDKNRCLQHNASIVEFNEDLIEQWGIRFFGCSSCIESCPLSKKSAVVTTDISDFTGYIGNIFDINNIWTFKKGEYKNAFRANQLAATWMEEVVHPRNILTSLHNQQRDDLVTKYKNEIDKFEWSEEEKKYLVNWCEILINRDKK